MLYLQVIAILGMFATTLWYFGLILPTVTLLKHSIDINKSKNVVFNLSLKHCQQCLTAFLN